MKKISCIVLLSSALCSSIFAADYYNSDGSYMYQSGNVMYHSDGSYSTRSGNTAYHSDGSYSTQIGNTINHSDGSFTTIIKQIVGITKSSKILR